MNSSYIIDRSLLNVFKLEPGGFMPLTWRVFPNPCGGTDLYLNFDELINVERNMIIRAHK